MIYSEEKKNKKKKYILLFLAFIFIIGIIIFLFLGKGKTNVKEKMRNLFPFGEKTSVKEKEHIIEKGEGKEVVEKEEKEKRKPEKRLRQVSHFPTGGFVPLVGNRDEIVKDIIVNAKGEKEEKSKTITVRDYSVRYSDIAYGNIFDAKIDPYSIREKQIAENFIPNVERAFFAPDGKHVALQYWKKDKRLAESYLGKITKKIPNVKPCPYSFDKDVNIGEKGPHILQLHQFLNQDPRTRVSLSGINSPGNEGDVASEKTITALKNFQAIYNLDIDGKIGTKTRKKLKEVCNERQKKKAEKELENEKFQYEVSGSFLPLGIETLSFSPDSKSLFTLTRDNIGTVGEIRNFESGKKETVFESPFHEWISQWNNELNIQLNTKTSYLAKSYSYGLNPIRKDYHKSLPEKEGLTTLVSPDNEKIYVHAVIDGSSTNYIYNKKTGEKTLLLDTHTFPEKCTWTKDSEWLYCFVPNNFREDGKYPDKWYQGLELFSDQLWKIKGDGLDEEMISDIPREYGKKLDAWKVGIDEDNAYIYFIDKGTETLWSYRLIDA